MQTNALADIRKTYNNIAIDLETFSTRPNAAVIQIGAVPFSIENGDLLEEEAFSIWVDPSQYEINANTTNNADLFHIDTETLRWWQEQDPFIQAKAGRLGEKLSVACVEFLQWVNSYCGAMDLDRKELIPWCQGASFDFPILENFLRVAGGVDSFFDFRNYRCGRTLWSLATESVDIKNLLTDSIPNFGKKHDALVDAKTLACRVMLASEIFGRGPHLRSLKEEAWKLDRVFSPSMTGDEKRDKIIDPIPSEAECIREILNAKIPVNNYKLGA